MDLLVGVGSGVINDLCKHVSNCLHIPYIIVATAPSMDGYVSIDVYKRQQVAGDP